MMPRLMGQGDRNVWLPPLHVKPEDVCPVGHEAPATPERPFGPVLVSSA